MKAALREPNPVLFHSAQGTVFASGCTSWYLDAEGVPGTWPWSYQAFADVMEHPVLAEYEFV